MTNATTSSAALPDLSAADIRDSTPQLTPVDAARATIRDAAAAHLTVVLDDDPTGSQSVHGIPVLTRWQPDDLAWAIAQPTGGFFILTNTRGFNEAEARDIVTDIAQALDAAVAVAGVTCDIITRSDSTLRGHFPLETDVFVDRAAAAGEAFSVILLAPAYLAAGRITVDDVHYVEDGDRFVPVGRTGYAADATFGFTSSNLRDYVEEKTGGAVAAAQVVSLSLEDIRLGGPERVRDILLSCSDATPVVVNAVEDADLDIVVLGLLEAERAGARVLTRSGPSFVAARLGIAPRDPLTAEEVFADAARAGRRTEGGHGLVVVGSHVDLTTLQVATVRERFPELATVELDVPTLLADGDAELARATDALLAAVADGEVMLMTSRARVIGDTGHSSLVIAQTVSSALSTLAARAVDSGRVAWVIAKGGITSSDVATEGLGIRRAMVAGQLFPGIVSVWVRDGDSDPDRPHLAGLPYVVFAGNVGHAETLADAIAILRGMPDNETPRHPPPGCLTLHHTAITTKE